MPTYTLTDFKKLFDAAPKGARRRPEKVRVRVREQGVREPWVEQQEEVNESEPCFAAWLETEFLEVREAAGPRAPGIWLNNEAVEREQEFLRMDLGSIEGRHPRRDLNLPVLPLPFTLDDFALLADSDCFRHAAARWPNDTSVLRMDGINPRSAELMRVLQGRDETACPAALTTAGPIGTGTAAASAMAPGPSTLDAAQEAVNGDAGIAVHTAHQQPVLTSTKGMAYWVQVLDRHIALIDQRFPPRASAVQAIGYLRSLGDARLPNVGPFDRMCWKTDRGDRKSITKQRVANVLPQARRRASQLTTGQPNPDLYPGLPPILPA